MWTCASNQYWERCSCTAVQSYMIHKHVQQGPSCTCPQLFIETAPVVAKVSVGQSLNRSIPEEAPPGDSLLARSIKLGTRTTMLLVALQLGSHFRLLGSNTGLNVLKPYCPCKPCTATPTTMSTNVVTIYIYIYIYAYMTLMMTMKLCSSC